ncbi:MULTISPECIES: CBS domain-containing protein [unclassified Caballeronia]|uniref:CBS domain-containing protein n=1 Tax=unclassified Caballeronia TaxID=2646786 RepID=UPI001FD1DC26|nr:MULTISPECIES: CBS domain-containing protein [unclassified Caballeronia]
MKAGQICTLDVVTCRGDATALDAAQLMRGCHVGDVVVVDTRNGQTIPLGIVTDRDIAVSVVAQGVDASTLRASDIMTAPAVTAFDWEDAFCLPRRMRRLGVRRLVVIDDAGGLVGIVTEDDLVRFIGDYLTELSQVSTRQTVMEEKRRA